MFKTLKEIPCLKLLRIFIFDKSYVDIGKFRSKKMKLKKQNNLAPQNGQPIRNSLRERSKHVQHVYSTRNHQKIPFLINFFVQNFAGFWLHRTKTLIGSNFLEKNLFLMKIFAKKNSEFSLQD